MKYIKKGSSIIVKDSLNKETASVNLALIGRVENLNGQKIRFGGEEIDFENFESFQLEDGTIKPKSDFANMEELITWAFANFFFVAKPTGGGGGDVTTAQLNNAIATREPVITASTGVKYYAQNKTFRNVSDIQTATVSADEFFLKIQYETGAEVQLPPANFEEAGVTSVETHNLAHYSPTVFIVRHDQQDSEKKITIDELGINWTYRMPVSKSHDFQIKPSPAAFPPMTKDNVWIVLPDPFKDPNIQAGDYGGDAFTVAHSSASHIESLRVYADPSSTNPLIIKRFDGSVINVNDFLMISKGASIKFTFEYQEGDGNHYWQEIE